MSAEVKFAQDTVRSIQADAIVATSVLSHGSSLEISELVVGVTDGELVRLSPGETYRRIEANTPMLKNCVIALSKDYPNFKDKFWAAAKGEYPRKR